MKKTESIFYKILLGISTVLFFLQFSGLIGIISSFCIILIFTVLGLTLFYFSFIKSEFIGLVSGVTLFISGIIIYVSVNYDILRFIDLLFPSFVFISAVNFLMIYLTNREKKLSLIIAVLIFILSYLLLTEWNNNYYVGIINSFLFYLLDFWPSILFLITLILLIRNKN